jgi:thiamine monophosphate synthase
VAIGGIDRDNVASLLPYRPDMVAVIHGLFGQSDVFEAARELGALFEKTHD